MTLRAADLFDPVVHHLYERLPGTGNMLRQGVGRLVAGEQKQHVQAVLHAQLIPCLHVQLVAAARLHIVNRGLGERDHVVQLAVLNHHQGGEKFCDAGRSKGQMDVLAEYNGTGILVHDNARLRHDSRIRRPLRARESAEAGSRTHCRRQN